MREGQYLVTAGGGLWLLLAKITVSKIYKQEKYHSAAKRTVEAEQSWGNNEGQMEVPPEAIVREPSPVEANILVEELEQAMSRVPAEQRQIVEMLLQGYPIDVIAAAEESSERLVYRIRRRFREELETRLGMESR